MFKVTSIRHAFPEKAGFFIDRPNGLDEFLLLHFYNSVEIILHGKKIITEPHAVILYNSDTPEYYKSYEPLLHDWFHFKADKKDFTLTNLKFDKIYYPNNYNFITEIVAELENEFFKDENHKDFLSDIKVKELLVKLDRNITDNKDDLSKSEYIKDFRYLRGEIFSNLDKNWTVGNMAKRLGLSESHFYLLYKKIYGITPTADLINAKINSAKNMLLFRNMRVDDIATELGYNNTTHFIRQFKSNVGVSPTAYRNEFKNGRF